MRFSTVLILFISFNITHLLYAQNPIKHCEEDLIPKYDQQKKVWGFSNLFGQWVIDPFYTKVSPFEEDKAVVQKGLSYGVIACDGQVIVPTVYQSMTNYRGGRTWAMKNDKWGVLDEKGRVLLDFNYEEINPIVHTTLTWVRKNNLWGLFEEEKGKTLCQPQYSLVTIMSPNSSLVKLGEYYGVVNHVNCGYLIKPEITKVKKIAKNMIVFKQNNQWGLFNQYGILRLNPEFDTLFSKYPETVVGIKNKQWGLYDLSGKELLAPEYDSLGSLSEGYFSIYKKAKVGYATRQGKVFIEPTYQTASDFKNKMAIVSKDNQFGIIDYSNSQKLPLRYSKIERNSITGIFSILYPDNKYYLYNKDIQKISENGFQQIEIQDGEIARAKTKNKFNFIDTYTGIGITNNYYDSASVMSSEGAKVMQNKLWGYIQKNGKLLIEIKYDSIQSTQWNNKTLWNTWKNKLCGVIDTSGKEIFKNEYEKIYYASFGTLKIKKNNLWAIIKSNGQQLTSFQFQTISNSASHPNLPEWPAIVQLKNKYGMIDETGNLIVAINYDTISYKGFNIFLLNNGKDNQIFNTKGKASTDNNKYNNIKNISSQYIEVKKGKKWGIINHIGEEIIKPQYEEIEIFPQFFLIKLNKKWGTIDKINKIKTPVEYESFEIKADNIYLLKSGVNFLLDKNGMISLKNNKP
ncbi:MAG: WG repeat-containing protein [Cytophagales bacterium]|nr:MAG: WG repeat-containing protein [Cytophagales bacterium]